MVKYVAARSGSKYVVGREGCKSMVVNKLMYGYGALVWYQHECEDLEILWNGMEWDGGFGKLEMLEMNLLEERHNDVLLKRERQKQS